MPRRFSIGFIFACAGLAAAFSAVLHADDARLSNLSTRAQVGTGGDIMITGFVIGPGANKTVLIRAIGPTLANFGLTSGLLADPTLSLFSGSTLIGSNDNWLPADAPTFASVGAFALPTGSKDAALVATNLAPGGYTAQVSGVGNTTGLALLEVYEVGATAASSRLVNLSTRALVGTGATVMIPGISISPGAGTRKLLVRAAGPALTAFGVTGVLTDPTITVVNSAGTTIATNNDWGTPVGTTGVDGTVLTAAFTQAGAFAFPAGSKDAAILADFSPGGYTVQVSGVGNTSGVALVEVYDLTSTSPTTVSVVATKATSDESGANNGEFTITRSGDTLSALTVGYFMNGGAINAFDYVNLPGSITIPAGASSVKIPLNPLPDVETEGLESATLNLIAGSGYVLGAQSSATVTIADSPATLYVANLRPASGVSGSSASGVATILLSSSGTLASITISFSNLSSSEVGAHLRISPSGDFVFNLPIGQVSGSQWTFFPTGNYTSADLLNALKSGNIYVGLDTASHPTGEVSGTFIQGSGSQVFTAPAAAPAIDLSHATAPEASRFLTQATFGPKQSEVDALTNASLDAWITTQLAIPFTSHRTATLADFTTYGGDITNNVPATFNRQAAWFKNSLTAPDQLRQRVAFALSELFVVSDVSLGQPLVEGLANYYDVLGNGAFGNFRTLLENVTLSPVMGNYLSSLRNAKADTVAGTSPDENYAREVMQLFTIGLSLLQPDGTLKLDASGLPIPTYNQTTITEMAKVFTGWAYPSTNLNAFRTARADYITPMQLFPAYHDDSVKNIVNGVVIPANQGGAQDLKLALDALFNHPNTGPFIAKQLIQRLVTSNPSPGYVFRVAQKFENNGSGVRGDLAAVVRAILTDYEARSSTVFTNAGYGKLKEPLLRLTNLMRSFNASAPNGRYLGAATINGNNVGSVTALTNPQISLDEAALRSPTVFNFFHPAYVLPGPLAAAGLVAPEFEITDDTFSIDVPNFLRGFVFASSAGGTDQASVTLALNLTAEQTLVATPSALLDHLNLVLCGGNLPQATRDRITAALTALPVSTSTLERAQTAILLLTTSPAGSVQK